MIMFSSSDVLILSGPFYSVQGMRAILLPCACFIEATIPGVTYFRRGLYEKNLEGTGSCSASGRHIAGTAPVAADHGSDGARGSRQLQNAAARIRCDPAVCQLERPGRAGKDGTDRRRSRPAGGQWRFRGEPLAGTRRAEVPFTGAHRPG